MASSKGSPGIHDRKPGNPRRKCIRLNAKTGKPCTRWAGRGTSLCDGHKAEVLAAEAERQGSQVGKAITRRARQSVTSWVLDQQARDALAKLGKTERVTDPKQVLMDTVRSAWRQRQVWEAMLNSIPDADWSQLGSIPIPGLPGTARGARIEVIQRNLAEATKTASRASKLAIDAGIEERLVRLAEEQSALIADTVRAGIIAAIASLGLSGPAESKAMEIALGRAATHLRQLSAGEGEEIIEASAVELIPLGEGS